MNKRLERELSSFQSKENEQFSFIIFFFKGRAAASLEMGTIRKATESHNLITRKINCIH